MDGSGRAESQIIHGSPQTIQVVSPLSPAEIHQGVFTPIQGKWY
jgi:hypothetical protein